MVSHPFGKFLPELHFCHLYDKGNCYYVWRLSLLLITKPCHFGILSFAHLFVSTVGSLYVHGEYYGFLVLLRMVIAYIEEMLCVREYSASVHFSSFNPYNRTARWSITVIHVRKLKHRKINFSVAQPAN